MSVASILLILKIAVSIIYQLRHIGDEGMSFFCTSINQLGID